MRVDQGSACSDNQSAADQQQEVQRRLGRCLLRLQQYEQLLKAVLAYHDTGFVVSDIRATDAVQVARAETFATLTLGQLAGELFESYVVSMSESSDEDDESEAVVPTAVTVRFRSQVQMAQPDYDETKAAVKELVEMRNALVHNFIQRFDVWSSSGCTSAIEHLNSCYERVDAHFAKLRGWAESMNHSRKLAASFMQSQEFTDFLVNGILPDGSVSWPHAEIAHCLWEAEQMRAKDGWTRLDAAVAFITERYPNQTPGRYGCRSWPHVLNESGGFKVDVRPKTGEERVTWYRSRGGATSHRETR